MGDTLCPYCGSIPNTNYVHGEYLMRERRCDNVVCSHRPRVCLRDDVDPDDSELRRLWDAVAVAGRKGE